MKTHWFRKFVFVFFAVTNLIISQNINTTFNHLNDSISKQFYVLEDTKLFDMIARLDQLQSQQKSDSTKNIVQKHYGSYYYLKNDYEKALSYWIEAAKGFEVVTDSLGASKTYNNISLILNASKEYKKSLEYKKKALLLCPENLDQKWHLTLLHNIGYTYGLLKELDSFNYYINTAYSKSKKYKDSASVATIYNTLSSYSLKNGAFEKAIIYADSVQNTYRKFIRNAMYENSLYYSAEAYKNLNQYDKALEKIIESNQLSLNNGFIVNASDNYKLMAEIYEAKGDLNKAIDAQKKALIYKDSIFDLEKQKTVLELEEKYQAEKKEKENLVLKEQTVRKDLSIAKKNNIILISSLLFVVALVSLVIYQLKKFKNKNKALELAIENRNRLESELEVVRDNISKDFHDDLGNKLARISTISDYMLESADSIEKSEMLDSLRRINDDADHLYEGTRDFMFSLKSQSDMLEETITYLSDFAEDYFQSFDMNFYLEKQIDAHIKLPHYWNRQIIMIFKEAMTNAAKYSEATKTKLIVTCDDGNLKMKFQDNGKGYDERKVLRRSGLDNMIERAHKIGVQLQIETANSGTSVTLLAKLPASGGV